MLRGTIIIASIIVAKTMGEQVPVEDQKTPLAELLLATGPMPSQKVMGRAPASDITMANSVRFKGAKHFHWSRPVKKRSLKRKDEKERQRKAGRVLIKDQYAATPWFTKTGSAEVPKMEDLRIDMGKKERRLTAQKSWHPMAEDTDHNVKKWLIVDAEGAVLGRLASEIAKELLGKNSMYFTPGQSLGNNVIVTNAEKVKVTGRKFERKWYRRHSGRPGGLKVESFRELQERIPERIIEKAVVGMLPRNSYGRDLFRRLKVYKGPDHPHEAQQPEPLKVDEKVYRGSGKKEDALFELPEGMFAREPNWNDPEDVKLFMSSIEEAGKK